MEDVKLVPTDKMVKYCKVYSFIYSYDQHSNILKVV